MTLDQLYIVLSLIWLAVIVGSVFYGLLM